MKRCVNSILAQSFSDFELIIIDDGSKDASLNVIRQFSSSDDRIRVIAKANGGVSAARNAGLAIANGDYVTFIDVDDYWGRDFLSSFNVASDDLYVGGYHTVGEHEIREASYQRVRATTKEQLKECLDLHLTDMTFLTPWGKLFRRSIVEDNMLRFDEKMRVAEDVCFVWEFLSKITSLSLVTSREYYYYTESADYKYALSATDTFRTIDLVTSRLEVLKRVFDVEMDEPSFFVENYYIWLHKMFIKTKCSMHDYGMVRRFFLNDRIKSFYKRNKTRSYDKRLFYCFISTRMILPIYWAIKIFH